MVELDAPLPFDGTTTDLAADESVEVTVVLDRRAPLVPDARAPIDLATLRDRYGADPAALDRLTVHATAAGLTVASADAGSRLVTLQGTAAQVQGAFGTRLGRAGDDRVQTTSVQLPDTLVGDVIAVLGLDTRDAARYQTRLRPNASAETAYTPLDLATRYAFPAGDGTGQTVGIIELGGGYEVADVDAYCQGLGVGSPALTAVPVQGGKNVPGGDPSGADGEVCLDVEVVAVVVPKAAIRVYFAPNTDAGFVAALTQSVQDGVDVVSISWGSAESTWTASSTKAFDAAMADAAALGITVCVAAGDGGSADGQDDGRPHADFPASSPHGLGCGGTRLPTSGAEVVWNDGAQGGAGGGGVSTVFPVPDFQTGRTVDGSPLTGRGVPDVAADADPETGYRVRIDGADSVIGGTSAAAPLWAALIARLQQAGGSKRWLTPLLYAAPTGTLHDITSGDNGSYSATTGWDACTGLGSPAGADLSGL